MSISINREHIKQIAKELGFEVEFDSENPGVLNTLTGEHFDFKEIIADFFQENNTTEYSINHNILNEEIKTIKPQEIAIKKDDFTFENVGSTNMIVAS